MRSLSLPFDLDGYGRIKSTTSEEKIYADRVRFALMTIPGERIMHPTFGSTIPEQVFEVPDEIPDEVEVGVRQAFSDFLPGLNLENVSATLDDVESGTVSMEVNYNSATSGQTYSSQLEMDL